MNNKALIDHNIHNILHDQLTKIKLLANDNSIKNEQVEILKEKCLESERIIQEFKYKTYNNIENIKELNEKYEEANKNLIKVEIEKNSLKEQNKILIKQIKEIDEWKNQTKDKLQYCLEEKENIMVKENEKNFDKIQKEHKNLIFNLKNEKEKYFL